MTELFCQDITIACTAGNIQGRMQYMQGEERQAGVILCPPHPLLAGNIDNNVISHLQTALALHFPVLSFNYRNVGKSFKTDELPLFEYWQHLDETQEFRPIIHDTSQVLEWSTRFFKTFHLVGYSFGAFIARQALRPQALSFSAIAPPLGEHEFRLDEISCPSLFIFAEDDNLLKAQDITMPNKAITQVIAGSDHFFLQQEQEVSSRVTSFLLGI